MYSSTSKPVGLYATIASSSAKAASQDKLAAASTKLGTSIREARTLSTGAELIRTDTKLDLAAAKQMMVEIMKDPNVLAVEIGARIQSLFVPNDPLYAQQWHDRNGPGGTVAGIPANANPVEVLNLSIGGSGACSVAFQTAIDAAVARGTTVFVPPGNSGGDAAQPPPASCDSNGFAPAADNVLPALNLGPTTQDAQGYSWNAGTSMASPHVAGIAAVIQSASATPKTPAWVKQTIENTAYANRGFTGNCNFAAPCGAGIVDASAAVNMASGAAPCRRTRPARRRRASSCRMA